jgi:PhnB protein
MTHHVKPIPDGYHMLTPHLTVKGADRAIEYYTKVFGAKVQSRMATPDGKAVWHAELRIGDSVLMLADEDPTMGGKSPQTLGGVAGGIHVYSADVDGLFQMAIAAGGKPLMPPTDMFWGDRFARFEDPFGQQWGIACHTEDVPPAEMEKRGKEWAAKMAQSH